MGTYVCWGPDHEDLAAQVRLKVRYEDEDHGEIEVMRFVESIPDPRAWRVIVTCSQGHDNAFQGVGEP